MQGKKHYLTKQGLKKIQKELEYLKKLKITKIKGEVPRFFHSGELDPEYFAFQEDMGRLEERIAELNDVLKNYETIGVPLKSEQDRVQLGARVLIEMDGEIEEFTIVDKFEADPVNSKISNDSPLGKALLGRRMGEMVEVNTPIINHFCKIIKIKYPQE